MPRLVTYYNFDYRLKNTELPSHAQQIAPSFYQLLDHNFCTFYYHLEKVHMSMTSYFLPNGELVMHRTNGIEGSAIKAHEFYHQLLHLLKVPFHSDSGHSIGGQKIWKRLAAYPDLDIKHYSYNKFAGMEMNFCDQEKTYLPFYRDDITKNYDVVKLPIESRFEVTAFPK
jgi:hypothetical protein